MTDVADAYIRWCATKGLGPMECVIAEPAFRAGWAAHLDQAPEAGREPSVSEIILGFGRGGLCEVPTCRSPLDFLWYVLVPCRLLDNAARITPPTYRVCSLRCLRDTVITVMTEARRRDRERKAQVLATRQEADRQRKARRIS